MVPRRWSALVPLFILLPLILSFVPAADAAAGVTIQNFSFVPASVTVPAGATITWTNQDAAPHTATSVDNSFDTGTLKQGQSATLTFSKPGTFNYICSIHPFMKGTITVTAASQAAPAPVPAPPPAARPAMTAPAAAPAVAAPAAALPRMPQTGEGGAGEGSRIVWAVAGLGVLVLMCLALGATRRVDLRAGGAPPRP